MEYEFVYYYTVYCSSGDKGDLGRWRYAQALDPYIVTSNTKLSSEELEEKINDYVNNYNVKHPSKEIIRIVAKSGIEIMNLFKTTKGKKGKDIIFTDKYYCYKKLKKSDKLLKYNPEDTDGQELLRLARVRRMEQKLKRD